MPPAPAPGQEAASPFPLPPALMGLGPPPIQSPPAQSCTCPEPEPSSALWSLWLLILWGHKCQHLPAPVVPALPWVGQVVATGRAPGTRGERLIWLHQPWWREGRKAATGGLVGRGWEEAKTAPPYGGTEPKPSGGPVPGTSPARSCAVLKHGPYCRHALAGGSAPGTHAGRDLEIIYFHLQPAAGPEKAVRKQVRPTLHVCKCYPTFGAAHTY